MAGVANTNSECSHGGAATGSSTNVFVNGSPVIRVDDTWSNHMFEEELHSDNKILTGSSKVSANGKGIVCIGDILSCGATITTGSSNVFAG